jgi:ATP-binding cassette subfamily B protein
MKLLLSYLKNYRGYIALALFLAAINQLFSMMDPIILRYIIDDYATKFDKYTQEEFFKGVALLLSLGIGAAFMSRVAKNFQDTDQRHHPEAGSQNIRRWHQEFA